MFYDVTYEEPKDGKFTRVDLDPYRDFLEKLPAGNIATVTVDTGEVQRLKSGKVRGKDEMADERAFRQVAADMNIGLRITHKHLQNGTTQLRMMKQRKREFSQETLDKRKEALAKSRAAAKAKREAQNKTSQPQTQPKSQPKPAAPK